MTTIYIEGDFITLMTDAERYTALLLRHRHTIWRLCYNYARHVHGHADDLVQEACIALWEHLGHLRPDAGPAAERLWVVFNTRDTLRRLHRHRQPPHEPLTDTLADTLPDDRDTLHQLAADIVESLNDNDRRFVQMILDGYDASEIGHSLGLSTNAVYQRTYRIIQKLKKIHHAK